jgi:hypothetical protein
MSSISALGKFWKALVSIISPIRNIWLKCYNGVLMFNKDDDMAAIDQQPDKIDYIRIIPFILIHCFY